jgi:hypothetical protein
MKLTIHLLLHVQVLPPIVAPKKVGLMNVFLYFWSVPLPALDTQCMYQYTVVCVQNAHCGDLLGTLRDLLGTLHHAHSGDLPGT